MKRGEQLFNYNNDNTGGLDNLFLAILRLERMVCSHLGPGPNLTVCMDLPEFPKGFWKVRKLLVCDRFR